MTDKTGNRYRNTSFRNGGRIAGMGMSYDDYSEESGGCGYGGTVRVRLPHDNVKPEDLNGPVICVQKGRKTDG